MATQTPRSERPGSAESPTKRPALAASLTLLIRHAPSAEEAKNIFESSKATFKGEEVAGLGAPAYRTQVPAQLDVLKGPNWLIISVITGRTADLAGLEKVAREIVAKLQN